MVKSRSFSATWVIFALCVIGPEARSQDNDPSSARSSQQWFDTARSQLDSLQFATANQSLRWALQTGGASVDLVAQIYQLTAETSAALGDEPAAVSAFSHLISLVPAYKLPAGTSPKIAEPFAAAQAWMLSHRPLALHKATQTLANRQVTQVTVRIDSDPTQLVSSVRLMYSKSDGSSASLIAPNTGRAAVFSRLPAQIVAPVHAQALDRFGNTLVADIGEEAHIPLAPSSPTTETSNSVWLSPWPYAGASVVAAGIGVAFGLKYRTQRDDISTCDATPGACFPEGYAATKDAADRNQLVSLASFGTAIILGGVAVWLAVRGQSTQESAQQVTFTGTGVSSRF